MGALALRLLGSAAGALGLSLPLAAFLAGLVLAAVPTGWAAYEIGHGTGYGSGYAAGKAAADQTAALNKVREDLALARQDLAVARTASASAEAAASTNAAAAATAEERIQDYEAELAKRPAACGCGFAPGDVDRLRPDAWHRGGGPRPARPPPGR